MDLKLVLKALLFSIFLILPAAIAVVISSLLKAPLWLTITLGITGLFLSLILLFTYCACAIAKFFEEEQSSRRR